MAHCDKFKLTDAKRIFKEYNRELDNYNNLVDRSRISLNYIIGSNDDAAGANNRLHNRIGQLEFRKRKDTVGFCTWIVTCPVEFKDDVLKQKEFFKFVYNFTVQRYGYENVLNGYVHCDETSPHIHIPFVPVIKADGVEKLNAKQLISKKELNGYQRDLEKECFEHFKIKGLILNGRTKGGYTLEELKQRSADAKALEEKKQKLDKREQLVEQERRGITQWAINKKHEMEKDAENYKHEVDEEYAQWKKQQELANQQWREKIKAEYKQQMAEECEKFKLECRQRMAEELSQYKQEYQQKVDAELEDFKMAYKRQVDEECKKFKQECQQKYEEAVSRIRRLHNTQTELEAVAQKENPATNEKSNRFAKAADEGFWNSY